ncbi:HAD family hydrolase [Bacillus kexueae]|uniref:HAD family hydrolase n=1 Tax=Aeribacillus kexueae TaxID=2078952 RepID=UPI001FAE857E|nr:HAD family hydrolase [Bacillus kexueae]
MKIKGILFDKDGTILNFHGLWSEVLNELVKSICKHYQVDKVKELSSSLLTSIDVTETSIIPNGIFASGTNEDIMEAFLRVMNQSGVKVDEDSFKPFVKEEMNRLVHERKHLITPTAPLVPLFSTLKEKGIKLGISTADDYEITMVCLEALNVKDYFDFIGTSDQYHKKPNPHMFQAFCEKFSLKAEEVAVVGDTTTDMQFGLNANAGLRIGVLSGTSNVENIEKESDFLIDHIGKLTDVLK